MMRILMSIAIAVSGATAFIATIDARATATKAAIAIDADGQATALKAVETSGGN